jgi:O-methyltransferase domain
MWGTGRRVLAVIVGTMTADHATEAPAVAGTRILLETTWATWRFAAIRGLLSIGAFERLAAGPLTIDELARGCGANAEILRRVLRCVAAAGLLRSAGPQRYELTDACRAAMDGWAYAGVLFNADPEIWNALGEITETIRSGKAPLIDRHGGLYGYLATQPATAAGFDALVKSSYTPVASALAQAIDFGELGTVVDVGGGHGGFITAILQAHRGVRGILTELDRALPGARTHLAATGLADRCDIVACDFFTDPLPPGARCYLLAHVIHNWNDEQALAILRAVRAAIPDNGRLLLVEAIIPGDDSPHLAKDLDIRLLTILPGGGRTEPEYTRLLDQAGFRPEPAVGLARIESVMAATPGS